PLGGLGEIGLNMMVMECADDLFVIDAGLMFPGDYLPGVDIVIPSFQYLRENARRFKAIVLTHGHEDHIGAVPFLLKEFPRPVFATGFTLALLKEKLREHGIVDQCDLRTVKQGDRIKLGPFTVEFISVVHSIVDGVGLAVETPEGLVLHSGDFKIDVTPVNGQYTDLNRFAALGDRGVSLMLSDSTNIEHEGFTISERHITAVIRDIFRGSEGRIIVAGFASNISRIQQVLKLSMEFGRKVLFSGKSMVTNVEIAKNLGFLTFPEDIEISERRLHDFPDDRLTVITTGSQGEPMSALSRMARESHKTLKVQPGDKIILSSKFIPGNEKAITTVINRLYRLGAEVFYEKVSEIHTSGHANREELKLMLNIVKPSHFTPIHGEYRHLVKHTELAMAMGFMGDRAVLAENGDILTLKNGIVSKQGRVETGRILVDGKGIGDIGEIVLRDRRKLSGEGMVIVFLAVDAETGDILYGPELISRGFIFLTTEGFILEDAKCIILEVLDELDHPAPVEIQEVSLQIQRSLKRFFHRVIDRFPMILPVIIPI
ncbi:MAG TPA: ribonuclease J, partial [Desulfobacteraceae bacterium]|nr:ribonuclease J [Desulfobacteraceae bacterium]